MRSFSIDFLWSGGDTYKGVKVAFDELSPYVFYVNGEKEWIDSYKIDELGWSSDYKYLKVATADVIFWVHPYDYSDFMSVLRFKQNMVIQYKAERQKRIEDFITSKLENFYVDYVNNECAFCFIAGSENQAKRYVANYETVVHAVMNICHVHNGRYYKTAAKSAKCVVLLSPDTRDKATYQKYKSLGYMVVSAESFLEYFGVAGVYTTEMAGLDFAKYINDLRLML